MTAPLSSSNAQDGVVRALPATGERTATLVLDRETAWLEAARDLGPSEALGTQLAGLLHEDFRYQLSATSMEAVSCSMPRPIGAFSSKVKSPSKRLGRLTSRCATLAKLW